MKTGRPVRRLLQTSRQEMMMWTRGAVVEVGEVIRCQIYLEGKVFLMRCKRKKRVQDDSFWLKEEENLSCH